MKNILSFTRGSTQKSELLRYILVGGLCALADITLLYFFVAYLHIWYLAAATISFAVVTLFGYFGQKYFTFRDLSKNHKKQIPVFFIVAGVGLAINTLCMFLLVSIAGIWYITSSVMTKLIVLVWNFSAIKSFVFKKN